MSRSLPTPPEPWLRGPVPGVPPLLQPVAHALLHAREDVARLAAALPPEHLWTRPGGAASAGFHLQHLTGVLDRMATYAAGDALSRDQLAALAAEGVPDDALAPVTLADAFAARVDRFVASLAAVDEATLTEARAVGRAGLPSTVCGILVHAAEHTQRHVGALVVTVRVVAAS